jgi:cardiolipin synthase
VRPETGDSTPVVTPAPADTAPTQPADPAGADPAGRPAAAGAPAATARSAAARAEVAATAPVAPPADLPALGVLMFDGFSDWADGKLARRLNQTSRIGILLDPAADRLYILATLVAFGIRGIIPWWLAGVIVGRDVVLGLALPVLRRYGYGPPPVHYLGKAATLNLLYAFPLLLIAAGDGTLARIANPIGWAFTIWGSALYLWSGALYLYQVGQLVRTARRESAGAAR